jgi:hypothetical protein
MVEQLTGADPFDLVSDGSAPLTPSSWESLTLHAERLLDHVRAAAARAPGDRVRVEQVDDGTTGGGGQAGDGSGEDRCDEHLLLQARLDALQHILARCRRESFQALREQGWTGRRIAAHFGVGEKAVSKVLRAAADDRGQ